MNLNPLTQLDFYKTDHRRQYPKGTTLVYSNFTPRSTKHSIRADGVDDKVALFGLRYCIEWFLLKSFNEGFFQQPKAAVVAKYQRRMDTSLGKGAVPVDHVEALHDLGYLPISIRALPEGAVVNERVPLFTIENTLPEFFWLTNYLETILSCMLWRPCTSITTARKYRQLFLRFARLTGADESFCQFQGHDFSFRGMGSPQDAVMSGAAHMAAGFTGTDTVPAIDFLEDWYGANAETELIGCSVPATEHSVMCMGGLDGEYETFKRLITETYPKGIVSIVSDTWDFWQVVTDFLPRLKPEILARTGGFPIDRVVIRPDSGDPVKIICGDPDAHMDSPEFKGAIQCLWDTFGGTTTAKGFKVLDPHIGLIYGDSITLDRAHRILSGLKTKGFASTNVVLGIGSFTYTYVTRDSLGFAMKATAGAVDGVVREIFKDPKTDGGLKKSAKGFLAVHKDLDGDYYLRDQVTKEEAENCELKEVFRNGQHLIKPTLAEIRARINESVEKSLAANS